MQFKTWKNFNQYHNSNTDLGGINNSNSNTLIFKVIVIVIYYIDLGGDSNSNILIFKVIVIVIYYIISAAYRK